MRWTKASAKRLWVGRRRNAAAMFWYGNRGGEREGLRMLGWLVGSETEGIGFFFSVGFRRYICIEGKNDEKNPPSTDLQMDIRG